jgi:hypothetical protein
VFLRSHELKRDIEIRAQVNFTNVHQKNNHTQTDAY